MKDLPSQYSPELVPHGVEVFLSNPDPDTSKCSVIGADFHSAELRLNQGVDLSPKEPLTRPQAERAFLASLGMTQREQAAYWGVSSASIAHGISGGFKKLAIKEGLHHAIRRLFETDIIEVVEPFVLAEPPSETTYWLVDVLCRYDSLQEAHETEPGNIRDIFRDTAAYYGLRGLYDFTAWAYAAHILDPSTRTVEPFEYEPKSKSWSKPNLPDAFVWRSTANGFTVDVFDEEPCATLEFEGKDQQTAWLRAIYAEDGRIAVRNFFDMSGVSKYLSQAELGALAITMLGGTLYDIRRLGIIAPKRVLRELYEKIGVPKNLTIPYAPIRAIVHSFDRGIMCCEAPPIVDGMTPGERDRIKMMGSFDSHSHAAQSQNITPESMQVLLSRVTVGSLFPSLPGAYLMIRAADAYEDQM